MTQGLVRLRILRAAIGSTVSGVELSEDLAIAGHIVSLGTVHPVLDDLDKAGWLKRGGLTVKSKRSRYDRGTKKGREQFEDALIAVNQCLFEGRELLPSTTTVGGIRPRRPTRRQRSGRSSNESAPSGRTRPDEHTRNHAPQAERRISRRIASNDRRQGDGRRIRPFRALRLR